MHSRVNPVNQSLVSRSDVRAAVVRPPGPDGHLSQQEGGGGPVRPRRHQGVPGQEQAGLRHTQPRGES